MTYRSIIADLQYASFLLFYNLIKQSLIAINHVENNIFTADRLKSLAGAVNFRSLKQAELHGGHEVFRFGNEIDMLLGSFAEGNRPVRVAAANRCENAEAMPSL